MMVLIIESQHNRCLYLLVMLNILSLLCPLRELNKILVIMHIRSTQFRRYSDCTKKAIKHVNNYQLKGYQMIKTASVSGYIVNHKINYVTGILYYTHNTDPYTRLLTHW